MSNSKVFITGINGFVGQNLKPYLAQGFEVVGISRNKTAASLNYEFFFQEKQDYYSIVHLAGKAHDLKKTSHDDEYYEVNYELTKRLYNQFLQSEAKIFIYISSVKAVADDVDGVLTEEVVPNPVTVYGKSKLMAEEYILTNLPVHKKVFILRPCMIHGPENKGNLNLLFGLVGKGLPWPLGAFENQRSFLSIENLCFVIKELLENQTIPSGVYNVADDEPLSTNELIQLIANSQNKKPKILLISKRIMIALSKIGDLLHLPINSERLQKLTESYVVSNSKMKQAIGKPLPTTAAAGLLRTFKSFTTDVQ
jgi:nucleoside-diphosphate-sugar epimerase